MLGAAHLHHSTPFPSKNTQKSLAPGNPRFLLPNPNLVVDEVEPIPCMATALGPEHRVRTEEIELIREGIEQQVLGELLHGEDIDDQRAPLESLEREPLEDELGGDDGGAEDDNFRVLFAEVVGVGEEGDAQGSGGGGLVGSGVSEDGVPMADEGLGEELAEVTEPDDGDLELGGVAVVGGEFGLVVVELGCVEGLNSEAAAVVAEAESGGPS
ncbi:hypothetical protein PanWU01x14_095300 [Parasponia andersonii]|uniref:Uncharacterized protein n=1 Tax=Parasponia andersonii TaxID=3476 RepID=A0A2P5D5I2_PARAD|nr:hypothetical protein PanWU01x14_095300 [Parasponia andersonii]